MEEVDEIVIHTLRQIGCEIEDISSLREFSTDLTISGVVRCLKLINPSLEISHNVPPGMSARYRLGAALASECTSIGYKGEIGYQTFLYSNEGDLRKIFLFLIEKLPKDSEKVLDQPLGKLELLLKEYSECFKNCLNTPWLPHYCLPKPKYDAKLVTYNCLTGKVPYHCRFLSVPFLNKTWSVPKRELYASHYSQYFQTLPQQILPRSTLICSVLEKNEIKFASEIDEDQLSSYDLNLQVKQKVRQKAMDLLTHALQQVIPDSDKSLGKMHGILSSEEVKAKGSRFAHALELQFATPIKETSMQYNSVPEKDTGKEEEKRQKREEEISTFQANIDQVVTVIEQLDLQNKKLEGSIQKIRDVISKETEKIDSIKESYKVKKCTLSLLPDAENNIEKLQSVIESSSQRLINLATQWEQHRVPLIEKYRTLKELSSQRLNETQRKLEEIKQMHEKIRDTGAEAQHKDEMHKQLMASYEKLTKDLNRSAYTRRIMEIVGNIKKQKEEISKILTDTKNVQKEINRLSGKLERTFTVTDELIFRDAKKDESVRRVYKLLAALHENCSQLVQITEETGFIVREIRELEDHIEQENQKKIAATLERITSDYRQMQQENATLIAQLK